MEHELSLPFLQEPYISLVHIMLHTVHTLTPYLFDVHFT